MRREPGHTVPTETAPGFMGDVKALSTAAGGTVLSTTAVQILIPEGTDYLSITPRNFVTGVVAQVAFGPRLSVCKTADDGATFTDYSTEAQDGSASTDVTLSSLDTAANGDYLYVGAHRKITGVQVDIDAANGTASVLTAQIWTGGAWTDIAITDNTTSGGATFAVDGSITWTPPSTWTETRINRQTLYWIRFKVSVALDSSTTLNSLLAIPSASYMEMLEGQVFETAIDPVRYASVWALMNAGSGNLIVNAMSGPNKEF